MFVRILLAFSTLLWTFLSAAEFQYRPLVRTNAGLIRGLHIVKPGITYDSFKGIPYAKPPIGNLRFRAPVRPNSWIGIRDASKHGSFCANKYGFFGLPDSAGGSEDCLFLNVYTPSASNKKRAVMFWIHGGAFSSGNGDSILYGPEYFMKEDVVLVTVNYRLASFGFLSTDDENAVGNYGLKDIVLALKWVQANIYKFGGDPNQVTIFGQSAGSAACHYLMLSDMAKGLFKQAILQSGSSMTPSLFQPNPKPHAETFGRKLGLNFTNTKELMDQLRSLDYLTIMNAEYFLTDMEKPWALRPLMFVPSVEPTSSTEEKFLSKSPEEILLEGSYESKPIMAGVTSFEAMFLFPVLGQPGLINFYNLHPEFLAPLSYRLKDNSPQKAAVIQSMKKIYFGGNDTGSLEQWLQVYSDGMITFSADQAVRFHATQNKKPVYFYQFSFDGSLNFYKKVLNISLPGASHCDELSYLFNTELPGIVADSNSRLVQQRMTRMWANFAKTGNPTRSAQHKDDLIPVEWLPYNINNKFYLNIDQDFQLQQGLDRINKLSDLQRLLTGHF